MLPSPNLHIIRVLFNRTPVSPKNATSVPKPGTLGAKTPQNATSVRNFGTLDAFDTYPNKKVPAGGAGTLRVYQVC